MIIFDKQLENKNFTFLLKKLSPNKAFTDPHINLVFNQNMFQFFLNKESNRYTEGHINTYDAETSMFLDDLTITIACWYAKSLHCQVIGHGIKYAEWTDPFLP